jgi:hypothetical protein
MADGGGGANTADSYIGSLISLTSKSEIRYEGTLFSVDTENSNIALQNGTYPSMSFCLCHAFICIRSVFVPFVPFVQFGVESLLKAEFRVFRVRASVVDMKCCWCHLFFFNFLK